MRPLLLTDVDGVINTFPVGVPDEQAWLRGIGLVFQVQGMTFRIPVGITERFRRLETAFDPVWASGWEADAPPLVDTHLGFGGNWPVIRFMVRGRTPTWKLPAVRRWCEEHASDRPVAWIDDEFGLDAEDWADRRGHTLLVRTELDEGLTEAQTAALLEWAELDGWSSSPHPEELVARSPPVSPAGSGPDVRQDDQVERQASSAP